ncbi:phytanoyl-CoA dioxygenase family protein [Streptomyces sp. NPDC094034]|uniref:phytanoyl-CoA dioxygenase family protein n=1 Tax=Streptomyces sp. NPDC094034 TaxID=3155309 RepID=UPI00332F2496
MDRQPTVSAGELTAEQRSRLDEDGFLVLPDILSADQCDVWSAAVDEVWERQRTETHGYTEEPGVRFADNLLRHSLLFEGCLREPLVLDGVRAVLGPGIKLSLLNGRRTEPGYGLQPLHDLQRERGRPFQGCTTFWCLDAFTAANGTRVIPGSHLTGDPFLARCEDPLLPHPDETRVVARRGSVVIFNSHLIHGGSRNEAATPRRSVQCTFTLVGNQSYYDWRKLPQEIRHGLGPESVDLLGVEPSDSVEPN